MTPSQHIISILKAEHDQAAQAYTEAHTRRVYQETRSRQEFRSDKAAYEIVLEIVTATEREKTAKHYEQQAREAYELAVNTFIVPGMPYLIGKNDNEITVIDKRYNNTILRGPVELELQIRDLVQAANERLYNKVP